MTDGDLQDLLPAFLHRKKLRSWVNNVVCVVEKIGLSRLIQIENGLNPGIIPCNNNNFT